MRTWKRCKLKALKRCERFIKSYFIEGANKLIFKTE